MPKHHRRLIRRLRARHAMHGRAVTVLARRTRAGWWLVVREISMDAEPDVYVGNKRLDTIKAAMRDA